MKRLVSPILMLALISSLVLFQHCVVDDVVDYSTLNKPCLDDCTTVHGVFTTENGVPISDVMVEFDSEYSSGGYYANRQIRKIASGKTDANGRYEFSVYLRDSELYSFLMIYFTLPDTAAYFDGDWKLRLANEAFYQIFRRDSVLTANFHVPKRGSTLQFKVKNHDANNFVEASAYVYYGTRRDRINTGYLHRDSTMQSFPAAANQYTYIHYAKVINGQYQKPVRDSIYIKKNELAIYEFEF